MSAEIRRIVTSAEARPPSPQDPSASALHRVYEALDYAPIWQTSASGDALRQALATAADQGLGQHTLAAMQFGGTDQAASPTETAERDTRLTAAFLTYAAVMREGAVGADVFGPDWGITPDHLDAPAALVGAAKGGDIAGLIRALPPPDPRYGRLVAAFRNYRALVAVQGWPHAFGSGEIKLDGDDPRLVPLRERLIAEGDLPAGAAIIDLGAIRAALLRFQERNGLDPDGRIGARTLAALSMSAEQRLAQIAVNLERWRHLPRSFGETYVVVNAADASVELVQRGAPTLDMRAVVGDLKHPTPVLASKIIAVTFNPPWNIPRSIATREMLPKLRRNRDYLAANDIVILGAAGDPFGTDIDWRAVSAQRFPYRLRQLPGLRNALGSIKFEMPNGFDVYLHDTPAKGLFKLSRRGFSHGCVRLEHAADLAARLLADGSEYAPLSAIPVPGATEHIPLSHPVPVYVLYWTAFVDTDGRTNFRDDGYDRDPPIAAALDLAPTTSPAQALASSAPACTDTAG